MPSAVENMAERINDALRQHSDLIRAHDTVHPDRSECGGVGGCRMLLSESCSEEEIIQVVEVALRKGYAIGVSLAKGGGHA